MTLTATKSWPEQVDVLTGEDFCFGTLKDNGRSCLLGYVALNFIPSIACNPKPLRQTNERSIVHALQRSKIGTRVLKCLDIATHEMTDDGIIRNPTSLIPNLNDGEKLSKEKRPAKFSFVSHNAYVARRQREHLANIARIWNRSMELTGKYDCGEPNPLPRLPSKDN